MSISYGAPAHKSRNNGAQSHALQAYANLAQNMLQENVNVLSGDIQSVLQNPAVFTEMTQELMAGASPELQEQLETLYGNTRTVMLEESFNSGVNPITALSVPMLRVGFAKIAVREGLPTEPVEQPKFKVTTKRPYVLDAKTGDKHYLPAALTKKGELFQLPALSSNSITAQSGAIKDHDLLTPISKNANMRDEIDPDFAIVEVVFNSHTVPCEIRLDTNTNVLSGTVVDSGSGEKIQILGTLNREKGKLSVTGIGEHELTSIKVRGYVSSEANNAATTIGFDITGEEVVIGTGQPIESPVNIQSMTDVMAAYQIDSTMVHLETMSTVLAQSIDLKGVKFIKDSFAADNRVKETFDVKPPQNYLLGDTAWRDEIKRHIDRLVTKLQTNTNIYHGRAVIFAHPLDAQVISNVRWSFTSDEQPNSVAVDYKVASFTSSVTNYTLLQSPHFEQGKMYIVYIPADADFRTSVYFPYSFNTIRGTASPNNPNIPSIQMIQRSTFRTFTPMVAELAITNNN